MENEKLGYYLAMVLIVVVFGTFAYFFVRELSNPNSPVNAVASRPK